MPSKAAETAVPPQPAAPDQSAAATPARAPWEVPGGATPPPAPAPPVSTGGLGEVRARVHRKLIDRLNLANLERVDRDEVVATIRREVHELITAEGAPLN